MRLHPAVLISLLVLVAGVAAGAYFLLGTGATPRIAVFVGQPKPVLQEGPALAAPHGGASTIALLPKGLVVQVDGILDGGQWAEVTLPDKRVAYFPAGSLEVTPKGPQSSASGPAPADGPPVQFQPASDVYTIDKPVTVYVEPNVQAPQRYQIDAGTDVPVVARSTDGIWVRASTEDGQPAFLLAADLGAPKHGKDVVVPLDDGTTAAPDTEAATSPGPAAEADADEPPTIDGPAKVITTATLDIGGRHVALAGILGDDHSAYVEQLQTIIDSQGGTVHCVRQADGYQCKLPIGIDVALSALFNGAARPTEDAPPAYQAQAKSAQAAKRGLWH